LTTEESKFRRVMTMMGRRKRCIRGREFKGTSMAYEGEKIGDRMFVKLGI
jgi:hypothetical protein